MTNIVNEQIFLEKKVIDTDKHGVTHFMSVYYKLECYFSFFFYGNNIIFVCPFIGAVDNINLKWKSSMLLVILINKIKK